MDIECLGDEEVLPAVTHMSFVVLPLNSRFNSRVQRWCCHEHIGLSGHPAGSHRDLCGPQPQRSHWQCRW